MKHTIAIILFALAGAMMLASLVWAGWFIVQPRWLRWTLLGIVSGSIAIGVTLLNV